MHGATTASANRYAPPWLHWIALLFLCAAYPQGAFNKATDFPSAIAEMQHFGLAPAAPLAMATIAFEFGASLMILTGFHRWLGALGQTFDTALVNSVAKSRCCATRETNIRSYVPLSVAAAHLWRAIDRCRHEASRHDVAVRSAASVSKSADLVRRGDETAIIDA